MAELTRIAPALALAAILLAAAPAHAADIVPPPDVADAKAVEAFKEYWNAFDEHDSKTLGDGQKAFKKAWESVKENYQTDKAKLSQEQIAALQQAAAKYRSHLESHAGADNRPYVLLNLAQIQNLIGDHLLKDSQDGNAGTYAKEEALALLKEIETNHRTFPMREQAMYLRATVLESMDRDDEALAVWQALSTTARNTIYGVHAHVAVGDHMFGRDRNADAMNAYKRALDLLPDVEAADPGYERLRINYRLAWAAYRATELDAAIKATTEILSPTGKLRSIDQREKIQQDGVDLTGDALYELNNFNRTKEVLQRREIAHFAPAIGLRSLTRYSANGIHGEATRLGEWLVETFPLAKEAPSILQLTADSWGRVGQPPKRVAVLEKLALLLPAQSLWRSRNKDDPDSTKSMEDKARVASLAAALYHYDTGLASGNINAFTTAGSYYDILVNDQPNVATANEWRLKRAHCDYFAGNYEDAARGYEELKAAFKVDPEILQVASFQLVLANERRWRELYAKTGESGTVPNKSPTVRTALANLEKSIDEFAARFPGQSRSVDLLLVGAAANRDMEIFDRAGSYWQRSLVSQPSPAQRGVAIRGLVFAAMKTGSPGDVVEAARRFLKLEDWRALGLNIGNELRGVLSVATLDEGKRLNDNGRVLEAGTLLTQIAEEFGDVPDRDRIYRDGAYMLAIAGEWAGAQKAADNYLKAGLNRHRADMVYLLARAHEYQLRLHDAAKSYAELGDKYPRHPRAATSLSRAEKLAAAENDYDLAATAAATQAERSRTAAEKLANYERAVAYLDKADNPDKALNLAQRLLRASTTTGGKLRARILVARMTYRTGAEQEALDDLTILSKQIERQRPNVPAEDYQDLVGETNVMLGDEARRKFDDFRIADRSGDGGAAQVSGNVATKMRFFEELVQHYDKAAASGSVKWSTQARFQLAASADALADEIASLPARSNEQVTLKSQSRYNATIERLQAMARKYYSSNVLASRRDPARYRDDEWVKKSSLRMTSDTSEKPETRRKEIMPAALQDNLPSDWSM